MALVEALMECKSLISEGMEKYARDSTLLSGSGDVWRIHDALLNWIINRSYKELVLLICVVEF